MGRQRRPALAMLPAVPNEKFDTYAFCTGKEASHRAVMNAYHRHVRDFGPSAYWGLVSNLMKLKPAMTPRALLGLLKLGGYDPYVVARLADPLAKAIAAADANEQAAIAAALDRAWKNHFETTGGRDIALTMGELFLALEQPARALEFFNVSLEKRGAQSRVLKSLASCYEKLGDAGNAGLFRERLVEASGNG